MRNMANAKSKRDNNLTLYGTLNLADGTVTERVNDVDIDYRLIDSLKEFDGKEISIAIKEKVEVTPSTVN